MVDAVTRRHVSVGELNELLHNPVLHLAHPLHLPGVPLRDPVDLDNSGVDLIRCFLISGPAAANSARTTFEVTARPRVIGAMVRDSRRIPIIGEWPSPLAWAGLGLATAGILLTAGWRPRRQELRFSS